MAVLTVHDASDARLADYRDLTDVSLRRRLEPENGLYMAEGVKVLSRALAAGHQPRSVLVSERWLDSVEPLVPAAVPIFVAPTAVLEAVTGYDVHRGALAAMHRPALASVAEVVKGARVVVVLEGIVDHTNVGAIFRNCAALGVDAVLVSPSCGDPLYRRSVRVSMGTVFQVPWTRCGEPRELVPLLRERGFAVVGAGLTGDAVELSDFLSRRPDRLAIYFGSEGHGLSTGAMNLVDDVVRIDMANGVDSLNVASSTAIFLWALARD